MARRLCGFEPTMICGLCLLNFEGQAEGVTTDVIIADLLGSVKQ